MHHSRGSHGGVGGRVACLRVRCWNWSGPSQFSVTPRMTSVVLERQHRLGLEYSWMLTGTRTLSRALVFICKGDRVTTWRGQGP